MNFITNNPFRILGIPIDASMRETQKQITKTTRYLEVGKDISFESDFLFLGDFKRDSSSISKAASEIEQPANKILNALFWFWNSNHIDSLAFDQMAKDSPEKAIETWEKVVKEGEISAKNISCLLNLKSLCMGMSMMEPQINEKLFLKAVSLSGKFINHDEFESFSRLVAGEHVKVNTEDIEKKYISILHEYVKPFLNIDKGITTSEFLSSFETYSKKAVSFISAKFYGDPVKKIEDQINTTTEFREKNPIEAIAFGEALHKNTFPIVESLTKILGESDLNFQMISEKLANEILQCSIDFFNQVREDRVAYEDDGNKALSLCKIAKDISVGQSSIRINETIEFIEDWLKSAPNKDQVIGYEAINELQTLMNEAVELLNKSA